MFLMLGDSWLVTTNDWCLGQILARLAQDYVSKAMIGQNLRQEYGLGLAAVSGEKCCMMTQITAGREAREAPITKRCQLTDYTT